MCDPVRTMSSIRQERAYQVQSSGRQPSWSGRSSFIYGNCVHQFNRPDISIQGPDAPKPYYGNYVPSKCNRPDTKATPSGRPCRKFQNYFPDKKNLAHSDGHVSVWTRVSQNPFLSQFWVSKAYK